MSNARPTDIGNGILIHPLLVGVCSLLPAPGECLNASQRERFLRMFEEAINVLYPGRASADPDCGCHTLASGVTIYCSTHCPECNSA